MLYRSLAWSLVVGFALCATSQAAKPSKGAKSKPVESAPVAAADSAAPAAEIPAAVPAPVPTPVPTPAAPVSNRPVPSGPSFKDSRDGKVYATVTLGNQVWMGQNLDYKTDPSQCYENIVKNCDTYGRLYTWKTAQTVCPDGWHLPSDDEWASLEKALGDSAGQQLKASKDWLEGAGKDAAGFAGLPAGNHDKSGYFRELGYSTGFWTSSDKLVSGGICRQLDSRNASLLRATASKQNGFSVRCIRN